MLRMVLAVATLAIGSGCATKSVETSANRAAEQTPVLADNSRNSGQAAQAAAPATAPKAGDKVICREEMITNSRQRKNKICLTEAAWQARRSGAREKWDEMRSPATGVTRTSPSGN